MGLRLIRILSVCLLMVSSVWQAAAYATQFTDETQTVRLRWKTNLISVAVSTSLIKSNPYIKSGTDVEGAIERSLVSWEKVADIKFQISWTDKQTVSPAGKSGDGVSLITVASTPENLVLFGEDAQETSAKTRTFFNRKGSITEADIVLNPYAQFSTDGSFGTFDLEATLTHEIGHLLGLEHSSVMGATMHAHAGKNGIYNLPSFGARTLSEDDIAGVRSLYGAKNPSDVCCGIVSGKLTTANGKPAKNFQVWAEDFDSGRVAAGVVSSADGSFQIEGLAVGRYKIYTQAGEKFAGKLYSVETIGEVEISRGKTVNIVKKVGGGGGKKSFDLNYVGFNGQISDLAIPVNGGKSYIIYVGGKNLNAENTTIGFNSPFLKVTPKSLTNQDYGEDISVISFEVKVAADIPLGEYSFFLQTANDEVQFAVGSLTVESFVNPWNSYFSLEQTAN
ncbi:MAG: matrixin family metalloprotease [Acidobacteriota bacterium]|nr:matrixin family metalloprotease [Acidobacteriota bacterium]